MLWIVSAVAVLAIAALAWKARGAAVLRRCYVELSEWTEDGFDVLIATDDDARDELLKQARRDLRQMTAAHETMGVVRPPPYHLPSNRLSVSD